MEHGPTARKLSAAITRLYLANPNDGRCRWLYDAWSAFVVSKTYILLTDAQLYPLYKAFAGALAVARSLAEEQPTQTEVDVDLLNLAAESAQASFDNVQQAAREALQASSAVAAELEKPVIAFSRVLLIALSVPLLAGALLLALKVAPRR